MAYSINKTDGTILATVADGQVDTLSSDLTLIGKNYSGFGESLNENFVKLLENFSNVSPPPHPVRGQIWFDVSELKLKVYNGNGFVPVSSATISNSQPQSLGVGDLWFNDVDKQLYFYDGTTTILLGPDYSQSQGLSGLRVANILDSLNQNRVITYLYTNGILLGIFSKDTFTPKLPIEGFEGSIVPGFNAGTLAGLKFNVTATNAEKLGGQPASSYVRNDTSNIINGQIIISSNQGLIIGDANQGQFQVQDGNLIIANIASNKDITLNVRKGVLAEAAIRVRSLDRIVDIYEGFTDSHVRLGGNLTVTGDLAVEGTMTTINTSTVTVEDKNIELAKIPSPTDATADGGGIILKGASDHTLLWTQASTAWNSSEHINLETGKEFKINGVTVLSATSLGPGVTSIPGVTSFGPQIVLDIGPSGSPPGSPEPNVEMRLENNRISTVKDSLDIELAPDVNGNIALIGDPVYNSITNPTPYPRITGLADPSDAQDAATKEYVDNVVETRSLVFSMDISDGISNSGIEALLEVLAPVSEYRGGTIARVLCTLVSNSTSTLDINPLLSISTGLFQTGSGLSNAVTDVNVLTATLPAQAISITRIIKTFRISSGAWQFVP